MRIFCLWQHYGKEGRHVDMVRMSRYILLCIDGSRTYSVE